jgi:hypothetical protein
MSELSKHELDKLFQMGAERYEFGYNPAAWEQMTAMLDRRRRRRALFWWSAGVVAFLALIGLALWFFRPETDVKDKKPEPARVERVLPVPENTAPGKEGHDNLAPGLQQASTERAQKAPAQNEASSGKGSATSPKREREGHGILHQFVEFRPAVSEPVAPKSGEEAGASDIEITELSDEKTPEILTPFPLLPILSPSFIAGPGNRNAPEFTFRQPEPVRRRKPASHFAVGLGYSTGLNSVGWGDFSEREWKAGLSTEYRFGGKFGLGLGIQFLRMDYLAGKGEYSPPYGFWTRMIAPEATHGLCDMLEAPLWLKYYPLGYSRSGPFVGAGLASYLLLREDYWYYYSIDDPDLIRWWQTRETQSHWLAIGQISAGYQAGIGNRLALQIGPYLQAPLSGVGHGQVKIYSVGLDARLLWRMW